MDPKNLVLAKGWGKARLKGGMLLGAAPLAIDSLRFVDTR